MGQSTDAILMFGFPLEDGDGSTPEFLGEHSDLDDFLADQAGLDWGDDSYYERRKELVEQCPAELVLHCSGEYTMHILAVRGTVTTASRGYPEEISISTISQERIDSFKEWCENLEIQYQEPKWLLASMWM